MTLFFALALDELWEGEMRGFELGGRRVLVLRTPEGVRAYEDRCAHLGIPLSQGKLDSGVLTCSGHHFQYDARTGQGINPKSARLLPFPVRVDGGRILVDVPGPSEVGERG